MKDIIEIAGAGPAGLAAAITLAKAGREVIVHEAKNEVGGRFQCDFQGLENWTSKIDVLEELSMLGIATNFRSCGMSQGIVYDSSRKSYSIDNKTPLFYLVERGAQKGSLDSALKEQALSCGVDIRFNSRLKTMSNPGILATGPKAADAIAVGYHCKTTMPNGYWVICDDALAPEGYAYLLIWDGQATIKSCMFSDFKNEKIYVQRTLEAFEDLTGFEMIEPKAHGGTGNFLLPRSAYSGSHRMIGEHAGFQDTLWGFGMRIAIQSGVLAAQSLLTGENYDGLWQEKIGKPLKASIVNRALYARLGNRGYQLFLGKASKHKDLSTFLNKHYQFSLSKKILLAWAKSRLISHRRDKGCNHINCHCVWCRQQCEPN